MSRFTSRDASVLESVGTLKGRELDAVLGVAARCSAGHPQVVVCSPLVRGRPFPTTFWLVCPSVARAAGAAENENGVSSLENELRGRERELFAYHLLHARIRLALISTAQKKYMNAHRRSIARAAARGGVGGTAFRSGSRHAKCLHLHCASYLALGRHPAAHFLDGIIKASRCEASPRCANCANADALWAVRPQTPRQAVPAP